MAFAAVVGMIFAGIVAVAAPAQAAASMQLQITTPVQTFMEFGTDDFPYVFNAANGVVLNTGDVPLVITELCWTVGSDADHYAEGQTIQPGDTNTCGVEVPPGPGGQSVPFTLTIHATDPQGHETTAAADLTIAYTDVAPNPEVEVYTEQRIALIGKPITFTVDNHPMVAHHQYAGDPDYTVLGVTSALYGNLLDEDNAAVTNNTCPSSPGTCSYTATVSGPNSAHGLADTVTMTVKDDEGNVASGSAPVEVPLAGLSVSGPSMVTVPEGGATGSTAPEFTVTNTGTVSVTGVTCGAKTLAPGASSPCRVALAAGKPGSSAQTLTVGGKAGDATVQASKRFTVIRTDTPPVVTASVSSPAIVPIGGKVTITVSVTDQLVAGVRLGDPMWSVTAVRSPSFGQLLDPANKKITSGSCTGTPGSAWTCMFTGVVPAGTATGPFAETLLVTVADDEGTKRSVGAKVSTTVVGWLAKTPAAWAQTASASWPLIYVGSTRIRPGTPVGSVFVLPASCSAELAGTLEETLDGVVVGRASAACVLSARLLVAATAALLNEGSYGPSYPGASSTGAVRSRTNTTLTLGDAAKKSLTAEYEHWNTAP